MLSVFICEDEARHQKILTHCIQTHIENKKLDIEFALCTHNPQALLTHIEAHKTKGLYFLDIELEREENGLALAQAIRQHDPRGFIVFVTSHPRYMPLTLQYKVEPLAYISKTEKNLCQEIGTCIENA